MFFICAFNIFSAKKYIIKLFGIYIVFVKLIMFNYMIESIIIKNYVNNYII